MKSILFFSRKNLSQLYGRVSGYIDTIEKIHVAYSRSEAKDLMAFGIKPDYVYLEMFREAFDSIELSEDRVNEVDNDIIAQSGGRMNLNAAIQSDRGFAILSYEECLRSALAHYKVWNQIFTEHHVDVLEHEPCSLFFNYIAAVLCKKQGGCYTYHIAVSNDMYEYAYLNANNGEYDFYELKYNYLRFLNNPTYIDTIRCREFLKRFREDRTVFFGNLLRRKISYSRLYLSFLKEKIGNKNTANPYDRLYSNIDYWSYLNSGSTKEYDNLRAYRKGRIIFETTIPKGENYYFYPFHLEPEAVVQYLADGLYKNQVKLIENIAAALPPNVFLYVKDHPHTFAYRNAEDYARLMKVPNIRLLDSRIPAKEIINDSIGVVTINGTSGLEALFMGKQVYCFGTSMYSFMPRARYVKNIRDLRGMLYNNRDVQFLDDNEMYAFVMAFLSTAHPGYISGFVGGAQIPGFDVDENCKVIARDMESYVNNLTHYKESLSL